MDKNEKKIEGWVNKRGWVGGGGACGHQQALIGSCRPLPILLAQLLPSDSYNREVGPTHTQYFFLKYEKKTRLKEMRGKTRTFRFDTGRPRQLLAAV